MEMIFLLHFLLSAFLFFICFHLYLLLTSEKKPINKGFKMYPIVGALPGFLKNRHRFLEWSTETLSYCSSKTLLFKYPGKIHRIITADPLNVEHILKTNFENYPKGRAVTNLKDFFGQGMVTSDGDTWKFQRNTARYAFNTKSLQNFIMDNVNVEISRRLIPFLEKASKTKQVMDLQDTLERFAFDSVCKFAIDFDPSCLGGDGTVGGELLQSFGKATTLSLERLAYAFPLVWKFNKFFNLGSERKLKRSIRTVHEFAGDIVRSRMQQKTDKEGKDLLSWFIGNDENSPEFLRDVVINFISAGLDTTSSALCWFFWLLSLNQEVERNILKELETIREQKGKNIGDGYSLEEVRVMHYLQASISEALRLYPPAPVDIRSCRKEDKLPDGTFVGKGWFVMNHTYAMGRMESIWGNNCNEFVPERWLDNGICRQESPFKFPVFHAGPRMCLGKDMAYVQMKLIAASVIERFKFELRNKEKHPEHLFSFTLKMKGGLQVIVKERCMDIS